MSYPMNDFGNTTKWLERLIGTGEIIERTLDTAKIRNNALNDEGWLTAINSVNIIAEGILDVEIYADRHASKTALCINRDQQGDGFGFILERNSAYGVIAWQHGGSVYNMPDTKSIDTPVSLRIYVDATVLPSIVIYYYDGIEIFRGEISAWYRSTLTNQYINIYAKAGTIIGISTFMSAYTPPPQHNLIIQSTIGGNTNPTVGTYTYDEGTDIEVIATPISGYTFGHWELDGVNIGSVNTTIITMNTDHILSAFFAEIPLPSLHSLAINSAPIQGVSFTMERIS